MDILFTCGGRRVALLDAFRRALRELDVAGKIYVADVTSASAAYRYADEGILVPAVGTLEYLPRLLEFCKSRQVGLVIPLTDLDLRSLSRHREKFSALGAKVMIGPPHTVALCRDKTLTHGFLAKLGLPAIRTFTLERFRQEPFFPCFIKPVRGSASIGTGVLHSEVELKAHLATFGDVMLLQDYVPGAEYTIDAYRTGAGKVACVVPRQRLAVRSGEVEKALTVMDDELLEGIWGVLNLQCRRSPGGRAQVFEINLRFGGGAPLSIAAGADLPRYVLEETLGLPLSAKMRNFKPNLLMLRYDQAVFVESDDPQSLPGYDTPQNR